MKVARETVPLAMGTLVLSLVLAWPSAIRVSAQTAAPPAKDAVDARASVFIGAWTLNKDLSDQAQTPSSTDGTQGGGGNRPGAGGFGGGRGFGGRRGGGFGGGGGGGNATVDPQQAERMREALRDVTTPPDRLTIVSANTMVILTGPDGRTVRLSPDGKKVKDESTNVERKTKWDGGKLVSEITGLGSGKITETYTIDPDHHQLRVMTLIEGGRGGAPRTITHVYDQDQDAR